MKTLTVRELYEHLDAIRGVLFERADVDTMEVLLRVQDDDGGTMVGGLTSLDIDPGCTEIDAFVMDGDTDAESRYAGLVEVAHGDS